MTVSVTRSGAVDDGLAEVNVTDLVTMTRVEGATGVVDLRVEVSMTTVLDFCVEVTVTRVEGVTGVLDLRVEVTVTSSETMTGVDAVTVILVLLVVEVTVTNSVTMT